MLVGTLALSKSAGNLQRRLSAPVRPGELPRNNNMVPPSKLPPASRGMTAVLQGEQPSLGGLAQDEAGLVRGLLDKFRRKDLAGKPTDCKAAADALKAASGGKGIVQESASGYTPHVPGIEHTMWELGEQFVDTRPGMWRGIFSINPAARAALTGTTRHCTRPNPVTYIHALPELGGSRGHPYV